MKHLYLLENPLAILNRKALLFLLLFIFLSTLSGLAQTTSAPGKGKAPVLPPGNWSKSTREKVATMSTNLTNPGGYTFMISGPTNPCIGQSYIYTASGNIGCSVFEWSIEGGTYTGVGNRITVTWHSTSGSLTAVGGCPDEYGNLYMATGALYVNPVQSPNVAVTPAATSICAGSTVTLTASGASSYSWSHGMGSGASVNVSPTTTTTYTVTGTSGSCSKTTSVTITVNPVPAVPSVAGGGTLCHGQGTTLTASGSGASTFQWYSASGVQVHQGATFQLPATLVPGTHIYSVRGLSSSGCLSAPKNVSVQVNAPLPGMVMPTISNNDCGDRTITLSAVEGVTYYWQGTNPDGYSTQESNLTYTVNASGTYYVRAQNSTGCWGDPVGIPMTVNPIPATPAAPTVSTNLCGDKTLTRAALPVGGNVTWYWQGTDPTGESTTTYAETYVATIPGTHTYYLRAKNNSAACWGPAVGVQVTVDPIPAMPSITPVARFGSGTVNLQVQNSLPNQPYNWYSVASGGTLLHTGADFNPVITAPATTYYVASVSASGCESERRAVTATVFPVPVVTVQSGAAILGPGDQVTLGVQDNFNTYQWLRDGKPIDGKTNHTLEGVKDPGTYSVQVSVLHEAGILTAHAAPLAVLHGPAASNMNYIIENDVTERGITTYKDANKLSIEDMIQKVTYFDGLGRPLQTVLTQASPLKYDIINPITYDALGRIVKTYLPYVQGKSGAFRSGAVEEQGIFYEHKRDANGAIIPADELIAKDDTPYAVSIYESSPLNRVVKQGAPGEDWQPDALAVGYSQDHTIKTTLRTNGDTEVRLWEKDATTTDVVSNRYYSAGQLHVTQVQDEQGALTVEYKDLQGRVVAKKVQEDNTASSSSSETGFMITQYVYDALGNLVLVIQPEGYRQLTANTGSGGLTLNKSFQDTWCFRYKYDGKRRLIEKQVPGSDAVYMVYNERDQVVLTQDGNQRVGDDRWSFTKYDMLGRPIMTGEYIPKDGAGAALNWSQSQAQAEANLSSTQFERRTTTNDATHLTQGYTLTESFPAIAETELYTVTYYDDYNYPPISGYTFDTALGYTLEDQNKQVKGQVTGTRTKVLGEAGVWLTALHFYDAKYQLIQTVSDGYLNGGKVAQVERVTTRYNFVGQPEETLTKHKVDATITHLVRTKISYDHASRKKSEEQKTWTLSNGMGTEPKDFTMLAYYGYNELGQVVDKGLHSDGSSNFLQSVDMRYNIRGWLTSINDKDLTGDGDVFGLELTYNTPSNSTYKSGTNSPTQAQAYYNGNISEAIWRTTGDNLLRGYSYAYDNAKRLLHANYATEATDGESFQLWGMQYDANGNIKFLNRKGMRSKDTNGTKTYGTLDQLTYYYEPAKGNLLLGVDDDALPTTEEHDFEELVEYTIASPEYAYDANGNMQIDLNKGIASPIVYNHLNLPVRIEIAGKGIIEYTYSATGQKLRKVVTEGNESQTPKVSTTDYAGIFVHGPEVLFAHTAEGRVLYDPQADKPWRYEYHLKDHLGNLRVSIEEPTSDSEGLSLEPMMAQQEEANFGRVSETRHMDRGRARSGSHAALLGTGRNKPLGPGRRLAVRSGDRVRAEVYGLYEEEVKSNRGLDLAAWLLGAATAGATTLTEPMSGKGKALPYIGAGIALAPQVLQKEKGVPVAYIRYIVYDSDSSYVDSGYQMLTRQANGGWEKLELEYTVQQAGFVEVFLANESYEAAWFDDMSVQHLKPMLVQENHYDPWGLNLVGIEQPGSPNHKFQYNGKERQTELGLGWMDYGARMYDAQIGRFHTQDRFADKYLSLNPYQYGGNNPINIIDINGDSLYTVFANRSKEGLAIIQKMFKDEFGLNVGYNSKTSMLYWESDVENPELSQSESATNQLRAILQDTNGMKKRPNKHGKLEVGFNTGANYGDWSSKVSRIDLADFESDGRLKGLKYEGVETRAHNLARVFEHEFLGHQALLRGASADGTKFRTGKAVNIVNSFRRERGLMERLNYGDSSIRMLYGNTQNFENPKALRKYVKEVINSNIKHNHISR